MRVSMWIFWNMRQDVISLFSDNVSIKNGWGGIKTNTTIQASQQNVSTSNNSYSGKREVEKLTWYP